MWFTRFATKIFYLAAGDFNEASTIIESVQNLVSLKLIFKALDEAWYVYIYVLKPSYTTLFAESNN